MRLLGCRGGWFCRSITLGVMTFNVVDPLHRFWSHSIDFRIWPEALLQRIVEAPALPPDMDAGYTVLLDKDHLTQELRPATYQAYIPSRPSEDAYQTHIRDFFSDVPYVAKYLWRDELLPAKWCLDYDMKHEYLRPMLEWRMECDHDWSVPVRNLGKGLMKLLPPDISEPVCNRQKVRCKPLDWRVMAFGRSLNGDTLPMLASMFAYLTGLKCDCRQALRATGEQLCRRWDHGELGGALSHDSALSSGCKRGRPGTRVHLSL